MDFLREWLVTIMDALIPARFERPILLGAVLLLGVTCLGLGIWFLYCAGSGEGEALYVPAALFGGTGLLLLMFVVRFARRG